MKDLFDLTHPSTKEKYRLRTGRPQWITRFGGSIFGGGVAEEEGSLEWRTFDTGPAVVDFLAENGLIPPEGTLLRDYHERGWGFSVGVLENPPIAGLLGPFAIEFESEAIVFPLRFQSQAGEFVLSMYLLSDRILDHHAKSTWDLRGINVWENLHREAWFRGFTAVPDIAFPETLWSVIEILAKDVPMDRLSFYAWEGKDYNDYGRTTERFNQDFEIFPK